jgi:tight adherence protein C
MNWTNVIVALVGAAGIYLMWAALTAKMPENIGVSTSRQPVHTTPFLDRAFGPLITRLSYLMADLLRRADKDQERLRDAGYPPRYRSVYEFYAWKVMMAVFLFGVGLAAALGAGGCFLPLAFVLGVLGLFLPDLQLSQLARKRGELIRTEMAFTLHRLAIHTAAGKTLDAAILEICSRGRNGVFTRELRQVLKDVNKGMTMEESLEELKRRNLSIADLANLVDMIGASRKMGVKLTTTLRNQGNLMIDKVLNETEQRGLASSVQMVIPVGGLILPAIGIAVMGPGIYLAVSYFFFR